MIRRSHAVVGLSFVALAACGTSSSSPSGDADASAPFDAGFSDAALDSGGDPLDAAPDATAETGVASDVIGKITVGYQGWFAAVGDGSPADIWWHYDNDNHSPPSAADNFLKGWPDVTDFSTTYPTAFAALGNGMPAKLFSSYTAQTVQAHVQWMQQNGIDTAALQRFNDETPTRNSVATNLKSASETYGRKFYVMYDISGWTDFDTAIPTDWTNVIVGQLHLTASSAYAMQNGKPVVSLWGCGFSDRPGTVTTCTSLINFLKGQGLYVIGGVSLGWRTGGSGSLPDFESVYDLFDMLSPWMVGAIGNDGDSDSIRTSTNEPDVAYCQSHHIDYQPCVLPGDLSLHQRVHGDFMWHQFANMIQVGASGIYVSMFDEFGEGNQIAKTPADASMIPTDSSFLPLDEDGTACSADYYLRLTGDGGRMLKGEIPFTFTRPTSPM